MAGGHDRAHNLKNGVEQIEEKAAAMQRMAGFSNGDSLEKVRAGMNASLEQTAALLGLAEDAQDNSRRLREGVQRALAGMGVNLDLEAVDAAGNSTMDEH